jgi:hypothetical protein
MRLQPHGKQGAAWGTPAAQGSRQVQHNSPGMQQVRLFCAGLE